MNYEYIQEHRGKGLEIDVAKTEMDEMWSFIDDKTQPYWLWHAIDHQTGEPSAYCFGTREHQVLDELLELLGLFSIRVVYADDHVAYKKRFKDSVVITGKRDTQKIERKHLSLRTCRARLVRKGLRFSKSHFTHRIVAGLVINKWFFRRALPFSLI